MQIETMLYTKGGDCRLARLSFQKASVVDRPATLNTACFLVETKTTRRLNRIRRQTVVEDCDGTSSSSPRGHRERVGCYVWKVIKRRTRETQYNLQQMPQAVKTTI